MTTDMLVKGPGRGPSDEGQHVAGLCGTRKCCHDRYGRWGVTPRLLVRLVRLPAPGRGTRVRVVAYVRGQAMPRPLRLYIAGVVTLGAVALVVATFLYPPSDQIALTFTTSLFGSSRAGPPPSEYQILAGIAFWTVLTLIASALPVRLPMGSHQAVGLAPVVAAMALGGPAVAGWVAAIGTTEVRELRGKIPWYGTLANHAGTSFSSDCGRGYPDFNYRGLRPDCWMGYPSQLHRNPDWRGCPFWVEHRDRKRPLGPSDRTNTPVDHRRATLETPPSTAWLSHPWDG